jgi:hypothetical protein
VGVAVEQNVDTVLMIPNIRKESKSSNKIEYGLVNNEALVYLHWGYFFVKNIRFSYGKSLYL